MSTLYQADLVISGAGMAGVTLALAVAREGFSVLLLEQRGSSPERFVDEVKERLVTGYDARVSALTCASQQILTQLGAWPAMQQLRIQPYRQMSVWDGTGLGKVEFSADEMHEPALGYIAENSVTLAALYQQLSRFPSIRLLSGVTVSDLALPSEDGQETVVTLSNGSRCQTPLLVAAEGALSTTRQLAGVPMHEWDYGHEAIVTTVVTEQSHRQTAWQCFTEDGPLAFLPLADAEQKTSSIVWSTSPLHARALMALSDEQFSAELGQAFEHRLGAIQKVDRRYCHPLRQRHAQYYVKPGFALIADAAHTIHPLAGQGINLGLLDVATLAEVISAAHQAGENWGTEGVLRRYQRMRRGNNLKMTAAMEGFRRLFAPQPPLIQLARNIGMRVVNRLGPVKQHVVAEAMGLRGELPALAVRPIVD